MARVLIVLILVLLLASLGNAVPPPKDEEDLVLHMTRWEREEEWTKLNEMVRDINSTFKRISFRREDATVSLFTFEKLGLKIDQLLTECPWFTIAKEQYILNPRSVHVVLQRIPHRLENQLRVLTGIQHPPKELCGSLHKRVGHMTDSGWGSKMYMYLNTMNQNRFTIFIPYDSLTNTPSESVVYASISFCPNITNKFDCAFLPATSCVWTPPPFTPALIGDWHPTNFPRLFGNNSNVISDAQCETDSACKLHAKAETSYHRQLLKNFPYSENGLANSILPSPDFRDKNNQSRRNLVKPDTYENMNIFGLLFRPNYMYRALIAKEIREISDQLIKGSACTAIHIRRGDRSVVQETGNSHSTINGGNLRQGVKYESVNMTKFCEDHIRIGDGYDNCENKYSHTKISCQGLHDLGCYSR